MAEEKGFEPLVNLATYGELATRWFKPLTHSSSPFAIMEEKLGLVNLPKFNISEKKKFTSQN